MSNWKTQAKNLIGQAEIIEAIGIIEANGIKTGNCLSIAQDLEAETEKHVKNKTQFAPGKHESTRKSLTTLVGGF
jgi:copper homeostasis protein CutC